MKKILFILIAVFIALFFTACVWDTVQYCPYCSSNNITSNQDDTYKCNNEKCGKKFGAKMID